MLVVPRPEGIHIGLSTLAEHPVPTPDFTSCSFNSSRAFFENLSQSYEPKKFRVRTSVIPSPTKSRPNSLSPHRRVKWPPSPPKNSSQGSPELKLAELDNGRILTIPTKTLPSELPLLINPVSVCYKQIKLGGHNHLLIGRKVWSRADFTMYYDEFLLQLKATCTFFSSHKVCIATTTYLV